MADLPIISNDAQPTVIVDAINTANIAKVTSVGAVYVRDTLLGPNVYSTTIPTLIPAAAATDVLIIVGSATKVIRVLSLELFITQTVAAGTFTWLMIRRTSDDTGASVTLTPALHDTASPGATATVREYLVNPTLGTSGRILARAQIYHGSAATTQPIGYTFDFVNSGYDTGIVLRGITEALVLNFNGAAVPAGLTVYGTLTHTEE